MKPDTEPTPTLPEQIRFCETALQVGYSEEMTLHFLAILASLKRLSQQTAEGCGTCGGRRYVDCTKTDCECAGMGSDPCPDCSASPMAEAGLSKAVEHGARALELIAMVAGSLKQYAERDHDKGLCLRDAELLRRHALSLTASKGQWVQWSEGDPLPAPGNYWCSMYMLRDDSWFEAACQPQNFHHHGVRAYLRDPLPAYTPSTSV